MTCDEIYDAIIEGREGNYVLFDMAACFLRGFDPEKLHAMLKSSDLGIVSDGLFIASEIGSLASNYIADFRALAKSDDGEISRRASDLLSVYARSDEDPAAAAG
jgi:hypothetical protein